MYISKPKGHNALVTLWKDNSSLIIGKMTRSMLDILDKEGKKPEDTAPELKITVSDDLGKELAGLAMPMHKPVRTKISTQPTSEQPKKSNSEIDAMDVILGLAKYN